MPEIQIYISKNQEHPEELAKFLQCMANRAGVGRYRYGRRDRKRMYLSRLKKELTDYERTGNLEHLYNVATYCALECAAPENPKAHVDVTVPSSTRKDYGE